MTRAFAIVTTEPLFGQGDEVFFLRREAGQTFVYRVRTDGTGLHKVVDTSEPTVPPTSASAAGLRNSCASTGE